MKTNEMIKFDTEKFLAQLDKGLKTALKGMEDFKIQVLESYAKMDTLFMQALLKKPKPPKSHACHRTMSHQKAAGSKRRKPKYSWSLRKKRRMGLWNV